MTLFQNETSEKALLLREQNTRLREREVELNTQVKALVKQERDKLEQEKEIIKKDMRYKDQLIDQFKSQLKEAEGKVKVLEATLPEGEKGLKS